jgi:serine/threonine protein kinase
VSTSEPTLPSDLPDIPGYSLQEKIGDGGMGAIYRAVQLSLQRPVAIKFLSFPVTMTPVHAFQRESRLMASLTHPNIVAIHDCGQIQGQYYLVLEYVDGYTLRSRMQPGRPWPRDKAQRCLRAIADALTYIHSRGILHLDLKPENVLCTADDAVKITDFGLAITRIDARTRAELGLAQGTLDYCAPEQRFGLSVDPRTDLFALATLAYELLTGYQPGRVYRPASERNRALSPAVDEVLRRGLARDRDERYASVNEFRDSLEQALAQSPRRGWLWPTLAAALAVLVLLALLLAGAWLGDWVAWKGSSVP